MNANELRDMINAFCLVQPAYREWAQRNASAAAGEYGGDEAAAWSAIRASMQRTLDSVSPEDATAVLRRMEGGKVKIPPYGELALTVLRESRIAREPKSRKYEYNRRYACLDCLDTGLVHCWNPRFVEEYRSRFASITRAQQEVASYTKTGGGFDLSRYDPEGVVTAWTYDPPDWYYQAGRWWRNHTSGEGGGLQSMCECHCGCRQTPAKAKYNPAKMMKATQDSFADLTNWYATHEVNEVYEWQP